MPPPRDTSQFQTQIQTQSERAKNDISSKCYSYKVGIAVLILDEIDFQIKKVKKDTEGHFIIIKEIMHKEDNTY